MPAHASITARLAKATWPLSVTFKLISLTSQVVVRDATGQTVCLVKMKAFKLKEQVQVWADENKEEPLAEIKADNILDFSGCYSLSDAVGGQLGAVRRHGMRSFWKTHYEVMLGREREVRFEITEENPGAKLGDGLLSMIPLGAVVSGFLFHPRYGAKSAAGEVVMRLKKEAAFFEGKFSMEKVKSDLALEDEGALLLSFLMMVLLERQRG